MRSRYLAFIAIALAVSACNAAAQPTAPPAPTLVTTPGPLLAATATATETAAASPTPTRLPPGIKPKAKSAIDSSTLALICRTNDRTDHDSPIDLAGVACPEIIDVTLAILGPRAKDVVRIQAGSVCADPCSDKVIVGFKDGHLEGASAGWEESDGGVVPSSVTVAPFHSMDASAWPWGDAAKFDSPAVARPTLLLPASAELARRTPVPHCGVETISSGMPDLTAPDGTNPAARRCFASAVLTGHPAEYVSQASDESGRRVAVDRFMGSGPVLAYYGHGIPPDHGSWQKVEPSLIYIGKNNYVWFHPIAPVGWQ